jgi:polar amino acid transport system substrate-binding protein
MPMLRRLKSCCIALCLTLLVGGGSGSALAAGPAGALPEIEYGYPEQRPRAFTNEKGEFDGHYQKLLTVLFNKAGMSWHSASMPAARLMATLSTGPTNFSILVKNSLLDSCCIYSEKPVWHDELRVYYVGQKPPIRKKEDLVGKHIIVLNGFSYGGWINYIKDPANNITIETAKSHASAFAMLEAGRADYLLNYDEPARADGLVANPVKNLNSDVLDIVHMYFVISKSYPNAEGVLKRLESTYQTMRTEDVKRAYTK